MLSARDWVLGLGIVLLFLGWMCLPIGQEAGPKRVLSLFTRSADAGSFVPAARGLLVAGAALIGLAVILHRR